MASEFEDPVDYPRVTQAWPALPEQTSVRVGDVQYSKSQAMGLNPLEPEMLGVRRARTYRSPKSSWQGMTWRYYFDAEGRLVEYGEWANEAEVSRCVLHWTRTEVTMWTTEKGSLRRRVAGRHDAGRVLELQAAEASGRTSWLRFSWVGDRVVKAVSRWDHAASRSVFEVGWAPDGKIAHIVERQVNMRMGRTHFGETELVYSSRKAQLSPAEEEAYVSQLLELGESGGARGVVVALSDEEPPFPLPVFVTDDLNLERIRAGEVVPVCLRSELSEEDLEILNLQPSRHRLATRVAKRALEACASACPTLKWVLMDVESGRCWSPQSTQGSDGS